MSWKIIDGNPPFEDEFPQMYTVNDTPIMFWRIIDGDLPFRPTGYPQMCVVDDSPISFWRIIDGASPYRIEFPEMPKKPRIPKRYKGKHQTVIIPVYKQTVIVNIRARDPQTG